MITIFKYIILFVLLYPAARLLEAFLTIIV